jgi:hypothetical protein
LNAIDVARYPKIFRQTFPSSLPSQELQRRGLTTFHTTRPGTRRDPEDRFPGTFNLKRAPVLAHPFGIDERFDSPPDVVLDFSDPRERLALRVLKWPIISPKTRHERTLVATPHRDQQLCLGRQFGRQLLRARFRQVKPFFAHDADDFRVYTLPRIRPRGHSSRFRRIRELVEERCGHLRPARVVHAREKDRFHRSAA